MAMDRDIAVAVADALASGGALRRARGWEMLAATGVRGLRVLNESRLLGSLLLTELDPEAFDVLRSNAARFEAIGAVALPHDARTAPPGGPFDYVDLDPYGTPEPFLGTALDAIAPGGVLAITATDMRVLAGVERGACEHRYSARPVRGRLGPEGGLRILLAWIDRVAAERGRSVRPVVSYVRDHHVRAYLKVNAEAARSPSPVGFIDPAEFPGPLLKGPGPFGPMWLGPLFDPAVVRATQTPASCEHPVASGRFLELLREEAGVDAPFYYESNELARAIPLENPPPVADLLAALSSLGWAAARTHARPGAFRTPAPRTVVERVARETAERRTAATPRTPGSSRSSAPP
jgi:tRNA (guanine26-N2/guanine27-N2)-dimethyltransferase